MRLAHVQLFEDFGTRSLTVHALMVLAFANAILAGLVIGGELGVVSFVALLNLTAGLWIAHSIHSLGHAVGDGEYQGVLNELLTATDTSEARFDVGRFGRLLGLIAAVTAVALLTSAQVLSGAVFQVAVVAVGAIAVVTAITGVLIALGASYDESQQRWTEQIDRAAETDGGERKR